MDHGHCDCHCIDAGRDDIVCNFHTVVGYCNYDRDSYPVAAVTIICKYLVAATNLS